MKFLVILFAVIVAAQAFGIANYNQLGSFQDIIYGGRAHIPLCFPNGFPDRDVPTGRCYLEGFAGSWNWRNGPCLPPIVNGKLMPPCDGQFYTLTRY